MFPTVSSAIRADAARTQLLIHQSRVDFDEALRGENLCLLGGCEKCLEPIDQAYQAQIALEFGAWRS